MIKKNIIILALLFSFSAQAETKQALSIFAGAGLTNTSFTGSNNSTAYHFDQSGFVMGFEYSHNFLLSPDESIPLSFNGTFVTNSSWLAGLGYELSIVRVTGKVGYGLVNSDANLANSNVTASNNYGLIFGIGAEVKLTDSFGITANYISNKTYLGGITVHW